MAQQLELLKPSDEIKLVPREALVCKPNAMNLARYTLSLAELRIMYIALAKMNTSGAIERRYRIFISEYCYYYNVSRSTALRQLRSGIENLAERWVQWPKPDDPSKFEQIRWITTKDIQNSCDGYFEFVFHEDLAPHLSNLNSHYHWSNLFEMGKINKPDTWRLMDLLSEYKNLPFFDIEVEELLLRWELSEKHQDFAIFNRDVIKKAVKEINEKTNYTTRVEVTKRLAKKAHTLRFHIHVNLDTPQFPPGREVIEEVSKKTDIVEDGVFKNFGYESKASFLMAEVACNAKGFDWPMPYEDYNELAEMGEVTPV